MSTSSLAHEFLEFIELHSNTSLKSLAALVLRKCRELTEAEAGTIFILRRLKSARQLEALSLQNDAIRARSTLFRFPVDTRSIAGYIAISGETILLPDVDNIDPSFPFTFNRSFDDRTGYDTRSIMGFPLTTPEGRVIGVVQLINSLGAPDAHGRRHPIPFTDEHRSIVAPVSLIVGRVIERADALEQIAERNKRLSERNRQLREERERVVHLSAETERAFMMSVELLARAAEVHDEDTGNHILRVNEYSYLLATLLRERKYFCDEIRWAAALHDVGKMSVDMAVLKKKGRLDEREWQEMRRHTVYGFEILRGHPKLAMAADIAHCHHEMWAGTGYPRGLRGEQIPLSARIVAIADVYDALRSPRPYKAGFDHDKAVHIMTEGDDRLDPKKNFDPRLLRIFARHSLEFAKIWDALGANEGEAKQVANA